MNFIQQWLADAPRTRVIQIIMVSEPQFARQEIGFRVTLTESRFGNGYVVATATAASIAEACREVGNKVI